MIELKPCPFCGSKEAPKVIARRGFGARHDRFCVLCGLFDGGCGVETGWYQYPSEAIKAWNRRVE